MNILKSLFFITLLQTFQSVHAGTPVLCDSTWNPDIHTIQISNQNWELGYPIIKLGSDDKLKLSFDDFSKNIKDYYYTLIHCNSDWTADNLTFSEFADGFEQNPINEYFYSTNTIVNYIHYNLSLPNENCILKLSGNYILKVFADNDEDKIIFTKKFFIYESVANVDLKVTKPSLPVYSKQKQQFRLTVRPNINDLSDPYSEIGVFIFQNFNLGHSFTPRPTYVDNNQLVFDDPDDNYFDGVNEYRNFDAKSEKYQSQQVKGISYQGPYYTFDLHPDDVRFGKQYFFDNDLNGRYFIQNSLGTNKDIDADYFMINFHLIYPEPLIDGDVYVFGALSDWQCNSSNKMVYDFDLKQYKLSMLLKQGYYNYIYVYKAKNSNTIDLTYFEGNHSDTENDYLVFVYYKPLGGRYQRLIGFNIANSINK